MISQKFKHWLEPSGVKVYQITDGRKPCIHRFYDTDPISPSGRFLAVTQFPSEKRLPAPGDEAIVRVIDLHTAQDVYETHTAAWDTQVGAHAQWGGSDGELFFNRMDTSSWKPYGVKVNFRESTEMTLEQTVYMVSGDGGYALSPCLRRIGISQPGYGVIAPTDDSLRAEGASPTDGLYVTDTVTGHSDLLISLAELLDATGVRPPSHRSGGFYGFHVKWSPKSDRIMFIVRFVPDGAKLGNTLNYLFTLKSDGSEPSLALSPTQWAGGHHPNWCPDGRSIVMNLIYPRPPTLRISAAKFSRKVSKKLRIRFYPESTRLSFVRFDRVGGRFCNVAPGIVGSGHPSIDPSGRFLIADAYPDEEVAFGDGTVPIRKVALTSGDEVCAVRINTKPLFSGKNNELRIDPHPAWDSTGKFLTFNGRKGGCRSVFIADLTAVLGER